MRTQEAVARLGLHVVGADDVTVRTLSLGVYAVPTREGRPVAECIAGPCASAEDALAYLAHQLSACAFARAGIGAAVFDRKGNDHDQ